MRLVLVHRFVSNNSIRQSFFLYFFFTFRGLSICLPCKLILHSRCTRYNAISSMFFLFIATIARFLDIFCCLRFFFVCFFFALANVERMSVLVLVYGHRFFVLRWRFSSTERRRGKAIGKDTRTTKYSIDVVVLTLTKRKSQNVVIIE